VAYIDYPASIFTARLTIFDSNVLTLSSVLALSRFFENLCVHYGCCLSCRFQHR